ncbi:hypothetical protein EV646_106387 [Kribbella antiqua]|uniref:Uncharacterized protein n=1 Tax=Kribbella antiqua TaxID=2512217 RepID=A0A4R2IQK5_9ACTN|nr:hypothetical protein [Kribbella antiqua]TCO47147.1 hypothetical protein EV646_106387 [Kribbella antiqua]
MSYDVQVFGRQWVELSAESVAGSAGLVFGNDGRVLRGKRANYPFTVDGPFEMEAEDVPPEVVAHVLEPRWMWTILVEGSSPAEIPHAVKFAKRLAGAAAGVALDLQTGELVAKVNSRQRSRHRRRRGSICSSCVGTPSPPLTDTLPAELRAVQRGRYKLAPAQVIPTALCD